MTPAQRWQLISGGMVAAAALMAAWTAWRTLRAAPRPPAGLAARCRGLILEHPQSAGLLIVTALALPLPLALFGWAVADLWQHSTGLYGFLLLAPAAAAATAALAAASALAVAQVAARRLSGERAKWDLLLGSLFSLPPRFLLAAARRSLTGETSALTWWSAAALLVDGGDVSESAAKGAALAAAQPGIAALGEPLQGRARRAAALAVVGPMPIFFGFSSLPALAFAGYRLQFLLELDYTRYAVLCGVLALLFCAFVFVAALRAAVALAHASAIYLATTGVAAVRERVLARFQAAWVLPAAPVAPAPTAAAPASAPAAAPAPAPTAPDAGAPGPSLAS